MRKDQPDQPKKKDSEILLPSELIEGLDGKTVEFSTSSSTDESQRDTDATSFDQKTVEHVTNPSQSASDFSVVSGDLTTDGIGATVDGGDFSLAPRAPVPSKPPLPKQIGGYEILSILGRGGMGIVYKARHKKLDREVALKMVLAGSHASEDQLQRFIMEAKAVAHLQHPNIVQIFEVGEDEGLPFFSLEFVDGEGLEKQIRQKPLDPERAAQLTATLAKAMQYAHDNRIVHRDLKPANVLVAYTGVPKITDFGLAKRLEDADSSGSTRTGTIMGTPSYMSPEQARGDVHAIGPASDQYSLGAMLYEFMTGRPPFLAAKAVDTILQVMREEPVPPRQLQAKLPIDLETICLKALQKDPAKRYADCNAFADDLLRFTRGEPISARPVGQVERAWRWCKRNPVVASLGSLVALALLCIAVIASVSAWLVTSKNNELSRANNSLKTVNDQLDSSNQKLAVVNKSLEDKNKEVEAKNKEVEAKNTELTDANKEMVRRSERLEKYVQEVFTEVNKIDLKEVPRMKRFRDGILTKSLPLIDEFTAELPEGGQGVATKMSALLQLSKSYRELGQGKEAERTVMQLVDLAHKRVEVNTGSDASRNNLCLILKELSEIRREMNRDLRASQDALREAIQVAESMVAESKAAPDGKGVFPRYRREYVLADMLFSMGTCFYRQGSSRQALPYFERASQIFGQVLQQLKDGTAYKDWPATTARPSENDRKLQIDELQRTLTNSQTALAGALNRTGKGDLAEPILKQSLESAEKAYEADTESPSKLRFLIGILGTYGEFLTLNRRVDEAEKFFERAANLAKQLFVDENTDELEYQRATATAYLRYAQWSKSELADALGKESLRLRQAILNEEPEDDRRMIDLLCPLAIYGDLSELDAKTEKFFQAKNTDSEMMLEVCRALSQASLRRVGDDKADSIARSLKALQAAISLGHTDFITLEQDIYLAPLREVKEFQQIIENLRASAATQP